MRLIWLVLAKVGVWLKRKGRRRRRIEFSARRGAFDCQLVAEAALWDGGDPSAENVSARGWHTQTQHIHIQPAGLDTQRKGSQPARVRQPEQALEVNSNGSSNSAFCGLRRRRQCTMGAAVAAIWPPHSHTVGHTADDDWRTQASVATCERI